MFFLLFGWELNLVRIRKATYLRDIIVSKTSLLMAWYLLSLLSLDQCSLDKVVWFFKIGDQSNASKEVVFRLTSPSKSMLKKIIQNHVKNDNTITFCWGHWDVWENSVIFYLPTLVSQTHPLIIHILLLPHLPENRKKRIYQYMELIIQSKET